MNVEKVFVSYDKWLQDKIDNTDPYKRVTCPYCDGDGWYKYNDIDDPYLEGQDCYECSGDGVVEFCDLFDVEKTYIYSKNDFITEVKWDLVKLYNWNQQPLTEEIIDEVISKIK